MNIKLIIKKSIILVTIVSSTISFNAQIKYGAQAHGISNKSSFKTEGMESPKIEWKMGYGIGVFADIPMLYKFHLRPSLNYQQKGGKINQYSSINTSVGIQKTEIKLEYLEIPILFIYDLSKWYIGAGTSFGYGISGLVESTQNILSHSETVYYKPYKDIADGGLGFKQFDFSLTAVIGMSVFENGFIQLGFLHGLSNIENTEDWEGDKLKNRSIMVSLGYCFN